MKRFYFISLIFVFLCAALGELTRLPLATANGLLPNDLLLALLTGVWLFDKVFLERAWPPLKLSAPFLAFVGIAALSLINGSQALTLKETFLSGLYLVRFIEYGALIFIVSDLTKNDSKTHLRLFHILLASAGLLAIVGFLQLKFFPNFTEFQNLGWDPHINRLLSSWFDPNFVGGLFAFVISLILGFSLNLPLKKSWPYFLLAGVLFLALFLTYSRSAYLACIAAMGILGIFKSPKLLIGGLIAVLLLSSVSERAADRFTNMIYSAQSLMDSSSAELPDATARLRIESWQNAWIIIQDHPWLGVGYNTYSYVQRDYGFVKELKKHSATGSDSTLLTIWATTGLIGLVTYIWFLGALLYISFFNRKNGLALGFFAGLLGLLIHSIFVNSLLFTPLLIFFYASAGLLSSPNKPSTT
ncbi:MAG: O-antigen ligase family protein [Candidatus Gracilibacteria bacterium]|jgi:O-antigen ligase